VCAGGDQGEQFPFGALPGDAGFGQHLGCRPAALDEKAEQQVPGAYLVMAELPRFAGAELDHFFAPAVKGGRPGTSLLGGSRRCARSAASESGLVSQAPTMRPPASPGIAADPQQDVLGADVVVMMSLRLCLARTMTCLARPV
jgi:hypothetical protein